MKKRWGTEQTVVNQRVGASGYCLKHMVVEAGKRSSRHRHARKCETFVITSGILILRVGKAKLQKHFPEEKILVTPGTWHWFGSETGATFVEVSTIDHPDDTERDPNELSGDLERGDVPFVKKRGKLCS